jgi:AraC-like DNA-binding protein/quercetin dioxygenase-like cupin family protein
MSTLRQPPAAPAPPARVRTLALRLPTRYRIEEHDHGWAQLVYAVRGVMRVEAAAKEWVVPPLRSLWVPAGMRHSILTNGETWLRTVYLHPELAAGIAPDIRVLEVPPLLREVLLEVVRVGLLDPQDELHQSLTTILLAQLARAPELAFELPLPEDPRARRVADRVRGALDQNASLAELAPGSGASRRTLERLFLAETALSFARWRQQARLQHAVCRLAEGVDVTTLAFECGYESVSAFVAMFRHALGTTPGQYLRERGGEAG